MAERAVNKRWEDRHFWKEKTKEGRLAQPGRPRGERIRSWVGRGVASAKFSNLWDFAPCLSLSFFLSFLLSFFLSFFLFPFFHSFFLLLLIIFGSYLNLFFSPVVLGVFFSFFSPSNVNIKCSNATTKKNQCI